MIVHHLNVFKSSYISTILVSNSSCSSPRTSLPPVHPYLYLFCAPDLNEDIMLRTIVAQSCVMDGAYTSLSSELIGLLNKAFFHRYHCSIRSYPRDLQQSTPREMYLTRSNWYESCVHCEYAMFHRQQFTFLAACV